ncbi:hypothetical protein BT69DRAFT_109757 [Atractiella rhizophila]|nr:hypothetical protein BT69DRAFT_109757 [Atractiella rhizophila]
MSNEALYNSAAAFYLQGSYAESFHALSLMDSSTLAARTLRIAVMTALYVHKTPLHDSPAELTLSPKQFLDALVDGISGSESHNGAEGQSEEVMVAVAVAAVKMNERKWAKKRLRDWLNDNQNAGPALDIYVLHVLGPKDEESFSYIESLEDETKKTELRARLNKLKMVSARPARRKSKTKVPSNRTASFALQSSAPKSKDSWASVFRSYVAANNLSNLATIGLLFSFLSLLFKARNQALMKVLEALSWTSKPGML